MFNRKSVERALAKYSNHKDPMVVYYMKHVGPAIVKAAEIAATVNVPDVSFTTEDLQAAREGKSTLLSHGYFQIDPEVFAKAVNEIGSVLLATCKEEQDPAATQMEAVDFSVFTTPEMAQLASKDLDAYYEKAQELAGDSEVFPYFTRMVLALAVYAMLAKFSHEASMAIDPPFKKDDTVHHDRAHTCPTCGAEATLAAVVETASNGNVKKLYCTDCGTKWPYERIRCAECGNTSVSDFTYVHDEEDDEHRLHLCKGCGSSFPTLFDVDEMFIQPLVEQLVMMGLEKAYADEKPQN